MGHRTDETRRPSDSRTGSGKPRRLFILFDSNVWISQLGLRTQYGAAIRHFAHRNNAIVVIPEIVQIEVEAKLKSELLKHKESIEKSQRMLLPLLGSIHPMHLPTDEEIGEIVTNIIPDFDVEVRKLPLNVGVVRSSMIRAVRKIPPSRHKEQVRDGVIWGHCLELLEEGDVYLVSEDTDFYEGRRYENGLATELKMEVEELAATGTLTLRQDVTDLLEKLRRPIEITPGEIFDAVSELHRESIDELLTSHRFEIHGDVDGTVRYYATEDARKVHFEFDLERPCQDVTDSVRHSAVLRISGFGFIDPDTKSASDVKLARIRLDYPDWTPDDAARGTVFLSMSATLGAKVATHEVRFPLDTD